MPTDSFNKSFILNNLFLGLLSSPRRNTMALLNELKCTVCQVGDIPLDDEEISDLLIDINEWTVIEEKGIKKITKIFLFNDYLSALEFTNQVAHLAENEGHHPNIKLDWGKVTVTWWTHKIGGLHKNDFIMASKTDCLISELK